MMDRPALISAATQRNWAKLNTQNSEKLKRRANKTLSDKLIAPDRYICDDDLESIVQQVISSKSSVEDLFYSLCIQKLKSRCDNTINFERFIAEYGRQSIADITISDDLLCDTKRDWLGYLYQLKTPEGQRNLHGQYYTNSEIICKMISDIRPGHDKSFFDPCCGTGAFLMNIGAESISQLYGVDIDAVAVMIAKANLIAQFPNDTTYPQIIHADYLDNSTILRQKQFDYICTNPPWGISKTRQYDSDEITSGERSSIFFVNAFKQLKSDGTMTFLLPSSLLKVKVHQDFRSFILNKTKIKEITLYNERFNGVFTDFFSISVSKQCTAGKQTYSVNKNKEKTTITKTFSTNDTEIELNSTAEQKILTLIESRGFDTLSHSIWALGIVTGDNKNKLKTIKENGTEAIFTGKDISRYRLGSASHFIHYDRSSLQQCAKDEYYRSPEKLVYKFISKSLCFAYDNSSSLFLNSANILIPFIHGMSIKTVLAFLNSELFSYYYSKKHADIKILKGNLMTLPFPEITEQENIEISDMVDQILNGDNTFIEKVNDYIYSLYDIHSNMIHTIKHELWKL